LNTQLFERVKIVYNQRKTLDLNTEQLMLLDKTYKGFVRGGANLQDDQKDTYRKINEELSVLTVQYGKNLLTKTNDFQLVIENEKDLSGLPDFVVDMGTADTTAAGLKGKWLYILNKPSLIPEIVVRYRSPYFDHIFAGGYSSGYYGYQLAEVLDADAFEAFKESSLFDQKTAKAFRENILEKGGTDDPMKLYIQFRGAEPKTEPMLKRKGLI